MIVEAGWSRAVGNCWTFWWSHINVFRLGKWGDSRKVTEVYLLAPKASHTFILSRILLKLVLVLEYYFFELYIQ